MSDSDRTDPAAPAPGASIAETRPLGRTGIQVSTLGLGTGGLGGREQSEEAAGLLLNLAVDLGVRVFDAARSYGLAEERLARHLGHRRDQLVLVTKGGYGVEGIPDWTPTAVTLGIHRALKALKTDRLDVFLLHSCPEVVLGDDEILRALEDARSAGKVRAVGYSGDNAALATAEELPVFDVFECSVSAVDQANLGVIERVRQSGRGLLAKRALGNAAWTPTRPEAPDRALYWERFQAMGIVELGLPVDELILRFSTFTPGVGCALVGCSTVDHLRRCAQIVENGPLPADQVQQLKDRFASSHEAPWPAVV